jgi:hypothetical protein
MLFVLVAVLTARCAGGVDVKNGWANRNGVDFALRAFEAAAFGARRLGVLDFGVLDFFAMESVS